MEKMWFCVPNSLSFEGNLGENFKKFKIKFENYLIAIEADKKPDKVKVAILMNVIGDDAIEKYETFNITKEEKSQYDTVIKAFEDYCVPKRNESINRHLFFNRKQREGEKLDDFITELKKLSLTCDFGDIKDSLIKDRIISGIINNQLRDRLLREEAVDLEKCTRLCRASEAAEIQLRTLKGVDSIDEIKQDNQNKSYYGNNDNRQRGGNPNFQQNKTKNMPSTNRGINNQNKSEYRGMGQQVYRSYQTNGNESKNDDVFDCKRCGFQHGRRSCPAFNQQCRLCNKVGHFKRMCKNKSMFENKRFKVNTIKEDEENKFLGSVESGVSSAWYENVEIVDHNISINFKIDTGADCNVINIDSIKNCNVEISENNSNLLSYNGTKIEVLGVTYLKSRIKNKIYNIKYHITKQNTVPILGISTIEHTGLVKRIQTISQNIIEEFKSNFEGIGQIPNYEYEFALKDNYKARIEQARGIPFKIRDRFKQELDKMLEDGIIEKVDRPTEFVSQEVIVKKDDGSLRVCLDPQNLNSCLLREYYQMPTFNEITSNLSNAKIFSTLDCSKALYQIKLTEKSSLYTTFITPYGRYCFKRMPYGIKTASEIYHKKFKDIFIGIKNMEIYIDEIIIWSKTMGEHEEILRMVMKRAKENNIRFNLGKCKIAEKSIKFLGHVFEENGIRIDKDKIKAIEKMDKPKDKKAVERFLGTITYLAKFIKNVSDLTEPMRQLIKKNTIFKWEEIHDKVFEELKHIITKDPVLAFYDPNKDCVLSVDASGTGVGAVIMQDNKPVAYGSKAFTQTQVNWAQIEKEMNAIVYGCEKFHQYIAGKKLVVESDHKPLIPIFKKSLNEIPIRLQKMRLKLQKYDIELMHRPGKELIIADMLSRAHTDEMDEDNMMSDISILMIELKENMSDKKIQEIIEESNKDIEMLNLKSLIRSGWPTEKHLVPDNVKQYITYRETLFENDGLIWKNNRIVVPKKFRKEMINRLHYNHMGKEKTKLRARESIFWPNMNKEIDDIVENCESA